MVTFYSRPMFPKPPPESPRQAFADESFHETDEGGFYVLAAAVFDG